MTGLIIPIPRHSGRERDFFKTENYVDFDSHFIVRLSADKGSAILDDDWVSQANVNQRRGRAGRVRPGESYHLYTRSRFDEMPRFPVPELHRVPLQKVVLDLKVSFHVSHFQYISFLGAKNYFDGQTFISVE